MSLSGGGPDWSVIPGSGKNSKSKAEFTDEIKGAGTEGREYYKQGRIEIYP